MEKLTLIPHSKSRCRYNSKGRECSDCKKFKSWDEFNKNLRGFRLKCSYCRECSDLRNVKYREQNHERLRQQHQEYRDRNNGDDYRNYHRNYRRLQRQLRRCIENESDDE